LPEADDWNQSRRHNQSVYLHRAENSTLHKEEYPYQAFDIFQLSNANTQQCSPHESNNASQSHRHPSSSHHNRNPATRPRQAISLHAHIAQPITRVTHHTEWDPLCLRQTPIGGKESINDCMNETNPPKLAELLSAHTRLVRKGCGRDDRRQKNVSPFIKPSPPENASTRIVAPLEALLSMFQVTGPEREAERAQATTLTRVQSVLPRNKRSRQAKTRQAVIS
jgi:hypothetical protein